MQQFFFGDRNPGLEKLLIDLFCVSHGLLSLPLPPHSNAAIKKTKNKSNPIMTKTLKNKP